MWRGCAKPSILRQLLTRAPTSSLALQAYGKKGIGEVPGDATLEFDVELLSVKTDAIGYRTKLVEG